MGFFRETGRPNASRVVSATSAGTIVPLQLGKSIVVYDVLSSAAVELTDGGQTMMYVPAGHSNLTSPIRWTASKPVELVGSANITITYDVV